MNSNLSLDAQINTLGFRSVVIVIVTGLVSMFLPLDAPAGYAAEHADRVSWLNANKGMFILGWVNQIIAMFSLSAVFFGMAWKIASFNPLRAIIAAMVVLMSVVAFIIPKFIAVWTIPLLATTISTGAVGAELADPLLRMLNVSIPFSLYTSFDYLGFWLYAVFGLLVAGPLWHSRLSLKIASLAMGFFGFIYHCLLVALLTGALAATDIETWFLSASLLLLIAVVAMAFGFKDAEMTINTNRSSHSNPGE